MKVLVDDLMAQVTRVEPQAMEGISPEAARRLIRAALRELRRTFEAQAGGAVLEPVQVARLGRFQPMARGASWQFMPESVHAQPVAGESAGAARAGLVSGAFASAPSAAANVLIHPEHRFAMIFSPKSACSTAVIWFLHTLGLVDEARAHSEWPHDYRIDRLRHADSQRIGRQLPLASLKVLRIVRDPVDRAASSFRHALGTRYARDSIKRQMGIDTETQGMSFEQFIDFLESEDLDHCDAHHRRQKNPLETTHPADFIINASRQDLFAGLNAFEREMGMPKTDFPALTWIHDVQSNRVPHSVDMGPDPDRLVLTQRQARRGPWPKGLVTAGARARLEQLYTEDIALYANVQPLV